jgi:regulator of protease activity HflC (stomatin/prohibitin superfamily)
VTQTRDFLERFRPAGAPGAAGRAGVPADRARELAVEVEPVLALLDDVHAECEQVLARAHREAEQIAANAQAEVARIGRDAERRARAARDEATSDVLAQARAEAQQAEAGAGRQALTVRRLAKRRMPALVATAVGLLLDSVEGTPPLAAGQDLTAGQPS